MSGVGWTSVISWVYDKAAFYLFPAFDAADYDLAAQDAAKRFSLTQFFYTNTVAGPVQRLVGLDRFGDPKYLNVYCVQHRCVISPLVESLPGEVESDGGNGWLASAAESVAGIISGPAGCTSSPGGSGTVKGEGVSVPADTYVVDFSGVDSADSPPDAVGGDSPDVTVEEKEEDAERPDMPDFVESVQDEDSLIEPDIPPQPDTVEDDDVEDDDGADDIKADDTEAENTEIEPDVPLEPETVEVDNGEPDGCSPADQCLEQDVVEDVAEDTDISVTGDEGVGGDADTEDADTAIADDDGVDTADGANTGDTNGEADAACLSKEMFCDGLDDDCNGEADDFAAIGASCADPGTKGVCHTTGVWACDPAQGLFLFCDMPKVKPQPESCNVLDDDCDGLTDEDLGQEICGVGPCKVTVEKCINGEPQICVPNAPTGEKCNGADDDCDGKVDNGFPIGAECKVGTGECENKSVFECSADGQSVACAIQSLPIPEDPEKSCDGLDNDCDGLVDNIFGGGDACAIGLGICASDGKFVCDPSKSAALFCDAPEVAPDTELCDGLDNDCNGQVDEVGLCDGVIKDGILVVIGYKDVGMTKPMTPCEMKSYLLSGYPATNPVPLPLPTEIKFDPAKQKPVNGVALCYHPINSTCTTESAPIEFVDEAVFFSQPVSWLAYWEVTENSASRGTLSAKSNQYTPYFQLALEVFAENEDGAECVYSFDTSFCAQTGLPDINSYSCK